MKNKNLVGIVRSLCDKKVSKVMVIGNYGDGNIGDEAMLRVIIGDLLSLGITNIVVPSRNPKKLGEIHPGLIKPISFKSFIKEFISTDLIIIGSGTLFSVNSSIFIYLIALLPILAKVFGKKTIYYAIGFSILTNKSVKLVGKLSFYFSDIISVRDKISLQNIKNLRINKKIYLSKDPALRLKPSNKFVNKILKKEGINKNKFLIGISLNHTVDKKINCLLTKEFTKVIDWLVETYDAEIVFFTFDPAFTHKNPDNKIAFTIKSNLKNKDAFKIINYYSSPEIILGLVGKMNFFIGMRYHSIMFSYMQGIPLLGIIYEEKNRTLLKDIKRKGVDLFDIDFDNVTQVLKLQIKI